MSKSKPKRTRVKGYSIFDRFNELSSNKAILRSLLLGFGVTSQSQDRGVILLTMGIIAIDIIAFFLPDKFKNPITSLFKSKRKRLVRYNKNPPEKTNPD